MAVGQLRKLLLPDPLGFDSAETQAQLRQISSAETLRPLLLRGELEKDFSVRRV